MDVEEYRRRVIAYLKSGVASDEVWREVAMHLSAESECGALLLDMELGLADRCMCGRIIWNGEPCDVCGPLVGVVA